MFLKLWKLIRKKLREIIANRRFVYDKMGFQSNVKIFTNFKKEFCSITSKIVKKSISLICCMCYNFFHKMIFALIPHAAIVAHKRTIFFLNGGG